MGTSVRQPSRDQSRIARVRMPAAEITPTHRRVFVDPYRVFMPDKPRMSSGRAAETQACSVSVIPTYQQTDQFAEVFCTPSTTKVSTGPLRDSSLRQSCSSTASKTDGAFDPTDAARKGLASRSS